MKRYFAHMMSKSTHERRQHAAGVAVVATGIITMGWLVSLGYSKVPANTTVAAGQSNEEQLASAITGAVHNAPRLEVSTTSIYSTQN